MPSTKKIFEGTFHSDPPPGWDEGARGHPALSSHALKSLKGSSDTPFSLVTHPDYQACEYKMRMNLFTFGRGSFSLPFTVVAPPLSVDEAGYTGSLPSLLKDYKNRRGNFLFLNLQEPPDLPRELALPVEKTLPSCVFYSRFADFSEYLAALRSPYRRRIRLALKRGDPLRIEATDPARFTARHHDLYLQVLGRSKYPLETLGAGFFRAFDGELYTFLHGGEPVAFVTLRRDGEVLKFIFGGMDYTLRDSLDLYYNMLLFILQRGLETGAKVINFGQTAETAKCLIGCVLSPRYMLAFSSNPLLGAGFRRFSSLFAYTPPHPLPRPFHTARPPGG